jgi:hypothetical protein
MVYLATGVKIFTRHTQLLRGTTWSHRRLMQWIGLQVSAMAHTKWATAHIYPFVVHINRVFFTLPFFQHRPVNPRVLQQALNAPLLLPHELRPEVVCW